MDRSNSTPVPLLDVKRQYQPLRDQLLAAVTHVCDSGRFVFGPECEEFERAVAAYTACGMPLRAHRGATRFCWR